METGLYCGMDRRDDMDLRLRRQGTPEMVNLVNKKPIYNALRHAARFGFRLGGPGLILVFLAGFVGGCAPFDMERTYREAAAHAKAGSFHLAASLSEDCLERDPDNINLLLLSGFSLYHLERYEEALETFRKASDLDKEEKNALAQYFYGWALYEQGNYGDAIRPLERAFRLRRQVEGLEPVLLVMLGVSCTEQNLTRGLGYLQSLRRYPAFANRPEVYNCIAMLQLKQGDYPTALNSFLEALRRDPGNPSVLQNTAVVYDQYLGQPRDAMRYYRYALAARQAIQDSSSQTDIRARLGQLVRLMQPTRGSSSREQSGG